jgi:hypothetical protein
LDRKQPGTEFDHLRFTREGNTSLILKDTSTNKKAGYLFTGIFPYNRDVFTDEKLFSSNVTPKKRPKTTQGEVKILKNFP